MGTRSTEEIEAETEKLVHELEGVVRETEGLLQAGAQELTEHGLKAQERLIAALEAAKETRHKIEGQVRASVKAADHLLREHPYQALGIAFGIGLFIGILMRRK
jgi:ElaB/YqjD/DUF883 family membrane-anchored ribosome-binding protein